LPFRYQQLVEIMALGKDNATISGLGIQLDGTAAYLLRRLAYLYRMPSLDVQINVGLNWISKPLQEFLTQF
jgi:NADH dehydrogenase